MRRALVLLLLCVWASGAPARADRPDPELTVARLLSDDAREVVWGAWLAAEHRMTAARRHVIPLFERLPTLRKGLSRWEAWVLEEHVLDLAIRLEVMPPRRLLEALTRGGRRSVAALLLAHPDPPGETLVSVFDRCASDYEPEAWVALGNLMTRRRTPGFAASVLRSRTLRRTLRVFDDDDEHAPPREPHAGICYDGVYIRPEAYPPTVVYGLTFDDRLPDGEYPVRWYRSVTREDQIGFGGVTGTWPDPGAVREHWLRRLVGPDGAQPPPHESYRDLKYVGRQPWERSIRAWFAEIHERHWQHVATLLERGVIRPHEIRSTPPRVELAVEDRREDTRHLLPPVPTIEAELPRWLASRLRRWTNDRR